MAKSGSWLAVILWLGAVALIFGAGLRWYGIWTDLNRLERIAAWQQITRQGIRDFAYHETVTDPQAVKLWLTAGRDPNGHDCAQWGRPPSAFDLAILRPLGFCNPHNADAMPFVRVTSMTSPRAVDAAALMISAGVNVNEVSPDGIVPLRSAVLFENEDMVKLLLENGADPLLKPKKNHIGDFRSAFETADALPRNPRANRIREMLRTAVERTDSGRLKKGSNR